MRQTIIYLKFISNLFLLFSQGFLFSVEKAIEI